MPWQSVSEGGQRECPRFCSNSCAIGTAATRLNSVCGSRVGRLRAGRRRGGYGLPLVIAVPDIRIVARWIIAIIPILNERGSCDIERIVGMRIIRAGIIGTVRGVVRNVITPIVSIGPTIGRPAERQADTWAVPT